MEDKNVTSKRFYYAHGVVWDTQKPNGLNGISIYDRDVGLRVTNWLSELSDELEQYKKQVEESIELLTKYEQELELLKKQIGSTLNETEIELEK